MKQYSKLSSDEFDSMMDQQAWLIPEVENVGLEFKTLKQLLQFKVQFNFQSNLLQSISYLVSGIYKDVVLE